MRLKRKLWVLIQSIEEGHYVSAANIPIEPLRTRLSRHRVKKDITPRGDGNIIMFACGASSIALRRTLPREGTEMTEHLCRSIIPRNVKKDITPRGDGNTSPVERKISVANG